MFWAFWTFCISIGVHATHTELMLTLMLSACAITRVDAPTPDTAPAQFKEALPASQTAAQPVPDAWWTLFQDPVLDELERRTERHACLHRNVKRRREPGNNVALSANATWELDLWGRLSMATQGAQATLHASEADLASARLSVQASLAQGYFSLRASEAQQELLQRNVLAYQRSLELTQVRYQAGVAGMTDVLQAKTQLNSTQTQLADAIAQRAQLEHALAVLSGVPPSSFGLPHTATLPAAVTVPASLPSTLLDRRPDIAAARERVKAAYALIGVNDAALFPTLSLSANAGYGQNSIANLLSAPNLLWNVGVGLTQSILDGGVRKQASAQARTSASAEQITFSYRQLVLTALQEVEDNLVLANRLQDEVNSQTGALERELRKTFMLHLGILSAHERLGLGLNRLRR